MSQPMEALALANDVRLAVAAEKRQLRALSITDGLLRAADILEHPPPTAQAIRLGDLLGSVRRLGTRRVDSFLTGLGVRSGVREWRIRDLDQGQREYLAAELRGWAARQRGRAGE